MTTREPESCPECAALVTDLSRHATWHSQVAQGGVAPAGQDGGQEGDAPDERIIGNMR